MAFTQLQYDAITDALAQGALTVKYADKEVTYRSLDEMIRIKGMMEHDLGISKNTSRAILTKYKSGLNSSIQQDGRFADGIEWDRL